MKKLLLLLAAVGVIFTACEKGLDNKGNGGMSGNSTKTIFYTSSDGNIVNPYRTDVFGANIVSNTYENGKGVIVFDTPVTSIGDYAFCECRSLTSITIGNGVKSIGNSAFEVCTSLTSITIGNGVKSIGYEAFNGCTSLTSVTIPDGVTWIGGYAFRGCTSLTAFYSKFASADNRCLIVDGVLNSFAPAGLTEYTIPDSVTSIGGYAFQSCTSLTSVTIHDSVTLIGDYAFRGCTSLTSVTIGNSVTKIGEWAFLDCTSLASITIPNSVTSIGDCAFWNCSSLPVIDGIRYADTYLVEAVDKTRTSYNIKPGTRFIGYAFSGCTSLTSVTIPNSVTSIGYEAFFGCTSLTNVTIPDGVTSIGRYAFDGCTSLTSVTIPDSVTSIGSSAFAYCTSLTSVYCKPTTPPAGDSNMFYSNATGRKIYVPRNSMNAYKAAEYWSDYASYIEGYDF